MFRTKEVVVKLQDSGGNGLPGNEAAYYNSASKEHQAIGKTDGNGEIRYQLLGGKYAFQVAYCGKTESKYQNIKKY